MATPSAHAAAPAATNNSNPGSSQPKRDFQSIPLAAVNSLGFFSHANTLNLGSLARELIPGNQGGFIDVTDTGKYVWTLSNPLKEEIPFIQLKEFKIQESQLKTRIDAFGAGTIKAGWNAFKAAVGGEASGNESILDIYKEFYDQSTPTNFVYKFPYFNKSNFELSTAEWKALGNISEAIKKGAEGSLGQVGQIISDIGDKAGQVMDFIGGSMSESYGMTDSPRVFSNHPTRSITISFTLFNTARPDSWKAHKALGYLLMNQNLYNKRDLLTGLPPVFYSVYIPNQFYSYASAMTEIKVTNIGNQRLIDKTIVPDAYQFDLTLSELLMPSKNQFQAIITGEAESKVQASTSRP
jgi:hypothetical protein